MKYLFTILLFLPGIIVAQHVDKYISAGVASNTYKGDMGTFDQWNGGLQIGVQFNKKKRANGAFLLNYGAISDQQPVSPVTQLSQSVGPNNYFRSNFISLNYEVHINIIKKNNITVYIGQGIGFIRFSPKDEFGESLESQTFTRAEQEDYRNSSFMLPSSLGAIYFLPNGLGLGLQSSFLNPLTDYLDNISKLGKSGNDNIFNIKFNLYFPLKLAGEN